MRQMECEGGDKVPPQIKLQPSKTPALRLSRSGRIRIYVVENFFHIVTALFALGVPEIRLPEAEAVHSSPRCLECAFVLRQQNAIILLRTEIVSSPIIRRSVPVNGRILVPADDDALSVFGLCAEHDQHIANAFSILRQRVDIFNAHLIVLVQKQSFFIAFPMLSFHEASALPVGADLKVVLFECVTLVSPSKCLPISYNILNSLFELINL